MTHTRGEQTYWYIACTRLFFLLDSHWKNSSAGMLSSVQQVTFSKSLLIQGGWCFAFFSISQSLIYKVSCTLLNVVWRFFFLVGCLFVFLLIISFLQVSTQSFRFSVTFYSLAILRRKKKNRTDDLGQCVREIHHVQVCCFVNSLSPMYVMLSLVC